MTTVKKVSGSWKTTSRHLLILGDGFTSSEADKDLYRNLAKMVSTAITGKDWYLRGNKALCVWRADTYVTNAHNTPLGLGPCPPVLGAPIPMTRFSTAYTADENGGCRYLSGDAWKVGDVEIELKGDPGLPKAFDHILVIVNYPRYGGKGLGKMAWASNDPQDFLNLAIHELGHTFGLYDEYENACGEPDPGKLVGQAKSFVSNNNISKNGTPAPWRGFVKGAFLQATKSTDSQCPPDNPVPDVDVGAFSGGFYTHRHFYRPSLSCLMREGEGEFCTICRKLIEHCLAPTKNKSPVT